MLIIKIGGPAYRIGMGGGAASSVPSGGSSRAELDFNAVQARLGNTCCMQLKSLCSFILRSVASAHSSILPSNHTT